MLLIRSVAFCDEESAWGLRLLQYKIKSNSPIFFLLGKGERLVSIPLYKIGPVAAFFYGEGECLFAKPD